MRYCLFCLVHSGFDCRAVHRGRPAEPNGHSRRSGQRRVTSFASSALKNTTVQSSSVCNTRFGPYCADLQPQSTQRTIAEGRAVFLFNVSIVPGALKTQCKCINAEADGSQRTAEIVLTVFPLRNPVPRRALSALKIETDR